MGYLGHPVGGPLKPSISNDDDDDATTTTTIK